MLRRAATGLLARPILGAKIRPFATDLSASAETPNAYFIDAWKKFIPNVDPPKTPLSFMRPLPPTASSIPTKLIVNLVLPYASELSGKEVDMVIIPAITGHMGILPGHEPIIAELKPGVLSLQEGSEVTKYFVSGGFAFVHSNSYTDIIAVEAVPLDNFDASLVQKGLAEFNQKLSSATTELEIAEAKIGIEVHSALNAALTG